jgi:hypothetical protein
MTRTQKARSAFAAYIQAKQDYTRAVISERDALKAELNEYRDDVASLNAEISSLRKAAQMALKALETLFLHDGYEGAVAVWRIGGSHAPRLAIEALGKELGQ